MMPVIPRISSAFSEGWVAWLMLLLLALLFIADHLQRGLIRNSFHNLFSNQERDSLFSELTPNIYGIISLRVYQIGILSMAIYSIIATETAFSILHYLIALAVVLVINTVSVLLRRLIMYVFASKEQTMVALHSYEGLTTAASILLYPVVLLNLFSPLLNEWINIIGYGSIVVFFVIVWFIKSFLIFFRKILDSIYILLYFCTLEILPVSSMIFAAYELIN